MKRVVAVFLFFLFSLYVVKGNPIGVDPLDSLSRDQALILVQEGLVEEQAINSFLDATQEKIRYSLRTITKEQLLLGLHVTEQQAQAFIDFRNSQPIESFTLARLKEIQGWDRATIDRVAPFLITEDSSLWKRHSLRPVRLDYKGALTIGYVQQRLKTKEIPIGKPYDLQLRTILQTTSLSLGLLADKDRYEPFFDRYIHSFDRYSFFLSAEAPLPYFKKLIIGDFSLSLGQGLIVRNSFLRGPYAASVVAESGSFKLRPSLTASGYDHFRGIASTIGTSQWELLLAYSNQKIDALLSEKGDSIGSLVYDQPHRYLGQIERRHVATERSLIGRLGFCSTTCQIGLNAIYVYWGGKTLSGYIPRYSGNPYAFQISSTYNISSDFCYRHPTGKLAVAGEVALSPNRQWATLCSIILRSPSQGNFYFVARALSPYYQARRANSFYQRGAAGNEWGFFFRYFLSGRSFLLDSYADYSATFIAPFRAHEPLKGLSAMLRLNYSLGDHLGLLSAVSWKKRLENESNLRLLLGVSWTPSDNLKIKLSSQYKLISDELRAKGFFTALAFQYTPLTFVKLHTTLAYYSTDSFKSRQYIYLPRVRYSSGSSMFYGRGWLIAAKLQATWKRWTIEGALRYHNSLIEYQEKAAVSTPRFWEITIGLNYHFSLNSSLKG